MKKREAIRAVWEVVTGRSGHTDGYLLKKRRGWEVETTVGVNFFIPENCPEGAIPFRYDRNDCTLKDIEEEFFLLEKNSSSQWVCFRR